MLLAGVLSSTRPSASPVQAARNFRQGLLFGLAATVLASGVAEAQMVMPGKLDVGQSGSASYSIPITVVPGTSGMEPKLALAYDSQTGNGLAGMGWNLSGLSTIGRCARTKVQDGIPGGITYNDKDRFCLDGQRLNLLSGAAYGAVGATYRTELEEFSEITSYAGAAGDPDWFRVRTKAGVTMEFGHSADSRIETAGAAPLFARVWALTKIIDAKGNFLTVQYTEDQANGEYRPLRVDYTGNTAAGLAPSASVRFTYEARTDYAPIFQGGRQIRNSQRLKTVGVYDAENVVRHYRLTHDYGSFTGRSRVTAVTQCDSAEANANCLPATTFAWSNRSQTFPAPTEWVTNFGGSGDTGWPSPAVNTLYFIDRNGDGKADFFGFKADGVYSGTSTGTGISAVTRLLTEYGSSAWSESGSHVFRTLADVNGDGKPDIVGFGEKPDGVLVSLANAAGTGYAAAAAWNQTFARQNGTTNSWDDAAKTDLTTTTQVWEGDGGENGNGCSCYKTVTSYRNDTDRVTPRMMADVNGDGRADIVGFGANDTWVSLSTGTTFGTKTKWSSSFGYRDYSTGANTSEIPKRFLTDMNGDGMADVVEFGDDGVFVALSTGTAFAARTQWSQSTNFAGYWNDTTRLFTIADVNGDGLPDVLCNTATRTSVALNTGSSLLAAVKWSDEFAIEGASAANPSTYKLNWNDLNKYPIQVVDVNADGMADMVGFGSNGVVVALSTGRSFVLQPAGPRWTSYFGNNEANGSWGGEATEPRFLADLNGDGITDIAGRNDDGATTADAVLVSISTGMPADYLLSITTGSGHVTQITYKPLSGVGAPYTKDTATLEGATNIQPSMYVVTEVKVPNGLGGTARSTYAYVGAKASSEGRGLLGFRQIYSMDEQSRMEQVTDFLQSYPFTGMTATVRKRYYPVGGSPIVLGQTTNYFESVSLNDGKNTYVRLKQTIEQAWDLAGDTAATAVQGVQLPTVTTNYAYDDWGNTTQVTVSTGDGYSKKTVNEYVNDSANWRLGRLMRATVTNTTP